MNPLRTVEMAWPSSWSDPSPGPGQPTDQTTVCQWSGVNAMSMVNHHSNCHNDYYHDHHIIIISPCVNTTTPFGNRRVHILPGPAVPVGQFVSHFPLFARIGDKQTHCRHCRRTDLTILGPFKKSYQTVRNHSKPHQIERERKSSQVDYWCG